MSFAFDTKVELAKTETANTCCLRSELLGAICYGASVEYADSSRRICVTTEHEEVAKRVSELFATVYGAKSTITRSGRQGTIEKVQVTDADTVELILSDLQLLDNRIVRFRINEDVVMTECCVGSFLRGAFMLGGSIVDPERNYHLELKTPHKTLSQETIEIMKKRGLLAKSVLRKSNYIVYMKDSERIADFLGVTGATQTMMELYNIIIVKSIRNGINRGMNCEARNMRKTAAAAGDQKAWIDAIVNGGGLNKLPEQLREIAQLRIDNPELSLKDLGQLLDPPLGKSGVNHRMQKIKEFALEFMEHEG